MFYALFDEITMVSHAMKILYKSETGHVLMRFACDYYAAKIISMIGTSFHSEKFTVIVLMASKYKKAFKEYLQLF